MNIQNNITTEDLMYDYENTSRYEIILTNNFLEFFPDPEERKFAIDEILDCLLNNHMVAIDEAYLLFNEGIIPFYSDVAELNGEKFNFHICWIKEKNYMHLILDKPNKGDHFKFFNINHEDNISMSEIVH